MTDLETFLLICVGLLLAINYMQYRNYALHILNTVKVFDAIIDGEVSPEQMGKWREEVKKEKQRA